MQRYAARVGLAIAVTAAAGLLSATSASALTCGQDLKRDVKLRKNLNCSASSSHGFVIAKHGVEIDLNGHKLIGDDSYYGIDNADGYDRLTVKNGRLEGWSYGVNNYYGSFAKFRGLNIVLGGDNSGYGIYQYYSLEPEVKNVTVNNAAYGIYGYSNAGIEVRKLKVTGSDSNNTYGIYDYDSTGVIDRLKANNAYYGLYTGGASDGYRVVNSVANNTGYAGFYISNSTPLFKYDYTLSNNTAKNSGTYGLYAQYDVRGRGNRATGAGTANCHNVRCG
jgi:hypothetical protein